VIAMNTTVTRLFGLMALVPLLIFGNVTAAGEKKPSGTVTIDETQIMWIVGGDVGGGTLNFKGQSYAFKMGGLKLGGFGVHQVKLIGDVWDLYDVGDFPGLYAAAEVGYTAEESGEGDVWLQNDKGVKLRLISPSSHGIALNMGVEGVDIRME